MQAHCCEDPLKDKYPQWMDIVISLILSKVPLWTDRSLMSLRILWNAACNQRIILPLVLSESGSVDPLNKDIYSNINNVARLSNGQWRQSFLLLRILIFSILFYLLKSMLFILFASFCKNVIFVSRYDKGFRSFL